MNLDKISERLEELWDMSFPIENRTRKMYEEIMSLNKERGNGAWEMSWEQYRDNVELVS